jgi:hypothetical protein
VIIGRRPEATRFIGRMIVVMQGDLQVGIVSDHLEWEA